MRGLGIMVAVVAAFGGFAAQADALTVTTTRTDDPALSRARRDRAPVAPVR